VGSKIKWLGGKVGHRCLIRLNWSSPNSYNSSQISILKTLIQHAYEFNNTQRKTQRCPWMSTPHDFVVLHSTIATMIWHHTTPLTLEPNRKKDHQYVDIKHNENQMSELYNFISKLHNFENLKVSFQTYNSKNWCKTHFNDFWLRMLV
jgi:hypothetical protein